MYDQPAEQRQRYLTPCQTRIAAFALILSVCLFSAVSAEAATPPWDCDRVADNYVVSCFSPETDDFWVYDAEKDGRSAVVIWVTSYGRTGICRNASGYGNWKRCGYDMREGETVYWEHYTYDAETDDYNYISGTYYSPISGGVPI